MKSEILVIAEAILANTQVLKMLVEKLPETVQQAVAEKVQITPVAPVVATPAPITIAPIPVAAPAPIPDPVVAAPIPTPVPAPVAQPAIIATPSATAGVCPIVDPKSLIKYVMDMYRELGKISQAHAMKIQDVMTSLGIANINDTKPEQYAALWSGIETLKG